MSNTVRFYFSFRSPYSWLAFYRINKVLNDLPVDFEFIPTYPSKEFSNDPKKNIRKSVYIAEDIKRFTDAYGLGLNWPKPFDTEWVLAHSAYFYAEENRKGIEFALEIYLSRFSLGHDIGNMEVLKDIGNRCGLNENELIEAAQSPVFHKQLDERMSQRNKDKIFGVPTFIYQGQKYWGNDRIDWLIRDIMRNNDNTVTDLLTDPFLRPY